MLIAVCYQHPYALMMLYLLGIDQGSNGYQLACRLAYCYQPAARKFRQLSAIMQAAIGAGHNADMRHGLAEGRGG